MIVVEHLSSRPAQGSALRDVSFVARRGRITLLLDPSGIGSAEVVRMLCGLRRPADGGVLLDGLPLHQTPMPARHVGVVLATAKHHPHRRGLAALELARDLTGRVQELDQVLERVGLTRAQARTRLGNCDTSLLRRLELGIALAGDPKVLVLENPFQGVDPDCALWLRDALQLFTAQGGTVLFSGTSRHQAPAIADDVVVLREGRVVAAGSLAELLHHPGSLTDCAETHRQALLHTLLAAGIPCRVRHDGSLDVDAEPEQVDAIARDAGIGLTLLSPATGNRLDHALQTPGLGGPVPEDDQPEDDRPDDARAVA